MRVSKILVRCAFILSCTIERDRTAVWCKTALLPSRPALTEFIHVRTGESHRSLLNRLAFFISDLERKARHAFV